MRKAKSYVIVGWVAVVVAAVLTVPLNNSVYYDRLVLGLRRPTPITKIVEFDPTAVTGVIAGAILGGFREVAASMLWMKTHEMWDAGEGGSLRALNLMRTVTLLDPHWLEPWKITGWHLAYNLYVETDDPAQRAEFLRMGVNALKEGISWNPDRYDLYFELGWTYFDKIRDYPNAAKWMEAALQFDHPEYVERLIAHGWERVPDMPRALDWYDYCIKRNPADGTAYGATLTIRERYLWAWRQAEARDFNGALDDMNTVLAVTPESGLALHMKAWVFEQAGRWRDALETWKLAAAVATLDYHARVRVAELSRKLGLEAPEYASDIYLQREGGKMAVPVPQQDTR
jgi:tetratricopeptide (TPR) repeat protein